MSKKTFFLLTVSALWWAHFEGHAKEEANPEFDTMFENLQPGEYSEAAACQACHEPGDPKLKKGPDRTFQELKELHDAKVPDFDHYM